MYISRPIHVIDSTEDKRKEAGVNAERRSKAGGMMTQVTQIGYE